MVLEAEGNEQAWQGSEAQAIMRQSSKMFIRQALPQLAWPGFLEENKSIPFQFQVDSCSQGVLVPRQLSCQGSYDAHPNKIRTSWTPLSQLRTKQQEQLWIMDDRSWPDLITDRGDDSYMVCPLPPFLLRVCPRNIMRT